MIISYYMCFFASTDDHYQVQVFPGVSCSPPPFVMDVDVRSSSSGVVEGREEEIREAMKDINPEIVRELVKFLGGLLPQELNPGNSPSLSGSVGRRPRKLSVNDRRGSFNSLPASPKVSEGASHQAVSILKASEEYNKQRSLSMSETCKSLAALVEIVYDRILPPVQMGSLKEKQEEDHQEEDHDVEDHEESMSLSMDEMLIHLYNRNPNVFNMLSAKGVVVQKGRGEDESHRLYWTLALDPWEVVKKYMEKVRESQDLNVLKAVSVVSSILAGAMDLMIFAFVLWERVKDIQNKDPNMAYYLIGPFILTLISDVFCLLKEYYKKKDGIKFREKLMMVCNAFSIFKELEQDSQGEFTNKKLNLNILRDHEFYPGVNRCKGFFDFTRNVGNENKVLFGFLEEMIDIGPDGRVFKLEKNITKRMDFSTQRKKIWNERKDSISSSKKITIPLLVVLSIVYLTLKFIDQLKYENRSDTGLWVSVLILGGITNVLRVWRFFSAMFILPGINDCISYWQEYDEGVEAITYSERKGGSPMSCAVRIPYGESDGKGKQ